MSKRSHVSFQASYRAPVRETFAYFVGPRSTDYGTEPQAAYIALYLGGHDGIRVAISEEHAREVAALLLRIADQGAPALDTDGPQSFANGPELVSA